MGEKASFTASMASRNDRLLTRKAADRMPRTRAQDLLLGLLSVPYTALASAAFVGMMLVVLPMLFLEIRRKQAGGNISTGEGGSKSAIKTLAGRAVTSMCGFGPDALAERLVRYRSLTGSGPVGRRVWRMYLWTVVWGFRLNRRIYTEQLVSLIYGSRIPIGDIGYIHVRTCWLDDMVERFVADRGDRAAQLVILGAGFDVRCQRLALPASLRRFEVDAPGTQQSKRLLLAELGLADAGTRYVSCDFTSQHWLERLCEAGFDPSLPTCVVWEGVTMYLTRAQVQENLRAAAGLAPGSVVGFDLFGPWCLAEWIRNASKRSGEPFQFGLSDGEVDAFVQDQGLTVLDHLGHEQVRARYLPQGPGGRDAGLVGDFGTFVVAGSPGVSGGAA